MEKKFTKGQWVIDSDFITVEVDGIDEVVCDLDPIDVYPTVYQRSEEEKDANAKLIAAAPDMLEALESFVYEIEKTRSGYNILEESYHLAKEAIKKATE